MDRQDPAKFNLKSSDEAGGAEGAGEAGEDKRANDKGRMTNDE
ncbi:MAG: hypothetical protein RID53_20890 [Coleofasciculus sp. B1-GNL1-01]